MDYKTPLLLLFLVPTIIRADSPLTAVYVKNMTSLGMNVKIHGGKLDGLSILYNDKVESPILLDGITSLEFQTFFINKDNKLISQILTTTPDDLKHPFIHIFVTKQRLGKGSSASSGCKIDARDDDN
jgi:hypothetical protein